MIAVSQMDDYTGLSALQAAQPEFAIFRRFMPLQAIQLNVMQAEIAHLRCGLGIQLELDRQAGDKHSLLSGLLSSFEIPNPEDGSLPQHSSKTKQKALWDRLDDTLERYSEQDPVVSLPRTVSSGLTQ